MTTEQVMKIGKVLKDHIPEILTGISVGCTVGSNIWTAAATKKYLKDGDKKHYIGPAVVGGIGITATIASDRMNSYQKASLIAAGTALAATNRKQRQAMEKKMTPEELAQFDQIKEFNDYAEGGPSGKTLYYMPQFGLKFWSTREDIERAERQANKFFDSDGQVSLEDILEFLKVMPKNPRLAEEDRMASRDIIYAFDWDSDEEQHLIFEMIPTRLMDVDCVRLKIKQIGAKWDSFQ